MGQRVGYRGLRFVILERLAERGRERNWPLDGFLRERLLRAVPQQSGQP